MIRSRARPGGAELGMGPTLSLITDLVSVLVAYRHLQGHPSRVPDSRRWPMIGWPGAITLSRA